MAEKAEQEVFELLAKCIPEIKKYENYCGNGITFSYNEITYRLECNMSDKDEIKIYKEGSECLRNGIGILSNPYGEGWNFNFSDIGKPNRDPFLFMLEPANAEELKEYLDLLAQAK